MLKTLANKSYKIRKFSRSKVIITKMLLLTLSIRGRRVRWAVKLIGFIAILDMISSGKMIGICAKVSRVISKVCRVAKEGNYNWKNMQNVCNLDFDYYSLIIFIDIESRT